MDRRHFVLGSLSVGALTLLPRCAGPAPEGNADGTLERPYTQDDPGPYADQVPVSVPVVYGALVDDKRVRLWAEVLDLRVNPPKPHEMILDHFIQELRLTDEFFNDIDQLAFSYEASARLITTVDIPERVQTIYAYALCTKHGWWRAAYSVADLRVKPEGDFRRPFTLTQPGDYADIAEKHVPVVGKRPDGTFAIEIGDRSKGYLHEMTPNHYIQQIVVLDQYHQVRALQNLNSQQPEPVVNGVNLAGTAKVRVVAYCNLHFYWEAEFSVA